MDNQPDTKISHLILIVGDTSVNPFYKQRILRRKQGVLNPDYRLGTTREGEVFGVKTQAADPGKAPA